MKSIQPGQRILRNRYTSPFKSLQLDGLPYEGLSYLQLDDDRLEGTGFHILKMEPGAVSPPHEHMSDEMFYVLDGELIDGDGTCYRAGDMVLLREGSRHFSHSPGGCTLIFYMETLERPVQQP